MPTICFRTTEFAFFKVARIGHAGRTELLTWRHLIDQALEREHGLFGSAVHVDILHVWSTSASHSPSLLAQDAFDGEQVEMVLIRVPRADKEKVWMSLHGELQVKGVSNYLTALL